MLVTNEEEIYQKGLVLREHGKANRNFNIHTEVGDNWRLSELHAVLGLQQMRKAQWLLSERRRLASIYDSLLAGYNNIERVEIPDEVKSAYYKYIVYLKKGINRDRIKQILREGFEIQLPGEVYAHPCHKQPLFEKYPTLLANDPKDSFPVTEAVCAQHICLPLYPGLSDDEVTYVVDCLKKIL
jgi:dTDP-4-amino-4,6-dideoxygalactose transaminase